MTETVLPGLASLLQLIQSNPALTADSDASADGSAGTSYLETAVLMLMSEVEVARRNSLSQPSVQSPGFGSELQTPKFYTPQVCHIKNKIAFWNP